MKLISDYLESVARLEEHTGCENLQDYSISFEALDSKFSIEEGELLYTKGGDEYSEEVAAIYRGVDLIAVLLSSIFGDGDYILILQTKNELV
jgi:hypothetical protein